MSIKNSCNFTRIVPEKETELCYNHKSIGYFEQGIFTSRCLELSQKIELINWLNDNKNIIDSVECFLLKHPLFEFPLPLYPIFQFVHHAQIGFIFKDREGKKIRHYCLQLQNSSWPVISSTSPFNLAQPCKIIDKDDNVTIQTNLIDKTAIFGHFLEKDNYMDENLIMMNKYTNFTGINLNFLRGKVNWNFFIESYNLWRMANTNVKIDPSKEIIVNNDFHSNYGQIEDKLKGDGDGKLFCLATFSPAYWSINEGTILHFATIKGSDNGKLSDKFGNFIDWVFNNLQCYDDPYQHFRSYSRNYITLSTSVLSLDWAKKVIKSNDNLVSLSNSLRTVGNVKALWLTDNTSWNPEGQAEKDFEQIMDAITKSRNIGQLIPDVSKNEFTYDYSSCPLVVNGSNYTCEVWTSMVISMILNTDTFNNDDTITDRKFNFNFPGAKFIPSSTYQTKPSDEKDNVYQTKTNNKPEKISPDSDYDLNDNLLRMYSAYWPVAIYEEGYENGIFESEFNKSTDPNIMNDRDEYSKQSMIFQYLFNGQDIMASNVTDNPFLKILSEFFSAPLLQSLFSFDRKSSTIISVFHHLMYIIFLYEFLKVETVYVAGYRTNDIDGFTFKKYDYFDCEPSIYKFKIGNSTKRGTANSKLLLALLSWITNGRQDSLKDFKLFEDSNINNPYTQQVKKDYNNVIQNFNNLNPNSSNFPKPNDVKDDSYCDKTYPNILNIPDPRNEICKLQNSINGITNTITKADYIYNNTSQLVNNTYKLFTDVVVNRKEVAIPLLEEFSNFISGKALSLVDIISGNMNRFTTWCHQNYELNPAIMINRYSNNDKDINKTQQIGNLKRRSDGICSTLNTCNLTSDNKELNQTINYQTKILKNCVVNLTTPFKPVNYFMTIIYIILFLLVIGGIGFYLYKRNKNDSTLKI